MPDLIAYLFGLFTLPALALLGGIVIATFVPDGFVRRECGACDWSQRDRVPIVRWARWSAHRAWGRFTSWHRQSLAVILLERGFDPVSNRRLGEQFRVTGPGVTSLTNMGLKSEARR